MRHWALNQGVGLVGALSTLSRGKETVLVAEEDPGVQGTVVTLLGELGYDIVTANDGKTALNLIKEGLRPDLRFTDVVMLRPTPSTELARQAKEIILAFPCCSRPATPTMP